MKFILKLFIISILFLNKINSAEIEETRSSWCFCWKKNPKRNVKLINLAKKNDYQAIYKMSQEDISDGIDQCDEFGFTPLMYALFNKNIELANFILDRNPNIKLRDKEKMTALHYAVIFVEGNIEIIEKLIKNKNFASVVNLPEKKGNTALLFAIALDHTETAKILLQNNANPFIPNDEDMTAQKIALIKEFNELNKIIRKIELENKAKFMRPGALLI